MSYIKNFDEARKRAKTRLKSTWMLPLILFGISLSVLIAISLSLAVWKLYLAYYPNQTIKDLDGSFLPLGMFLPLLFVSIPLGFMLSNFIASLIPPTTQKP